MQMSCDKCRFCANTEKPLLMGRGSKNSKIMIIQDAPSVLESRKRKQFYGKSCSNFINSMIKRDIDVSEVYFTSVLKCPAVPNDEDTYDLKQGDIKECQETLMAEINVINPDIIVPMGNMSLKLTYGKTGITKHRGNAMEIEIEGRKRIVLPIIHPRQALKKPMYKDYIFSDLDTLADLYENGMNEVADVDYRSLDTKEEAIQELERLNREAEWLSFDIETNKLNPFLGEPKVLCISLTDKERYGVVIPLMHRQSPIQGDDLKEVLKHLKVLMDNKAIKKVAHNGKFDIKWIWNVLGIYTENFCFDTMLAHYLCISEEKGTQGLKAQAWEFTDMGGYDNDLDEFKQTLPEASRGNYDLIPWEILSKYAVADVDCCMRLKNLYYPMIYGNEKWAVLMDEFMMPASYALMKLESTGIKMDETKIDAYKKSYGDEIKRIQDRMNAYPEVLEIERERREKWAIREELKKIKKKDRTEEEQKLFTEYAKYKEQEFNWNSTNQLKELLFERLNLTTEVRTDKGDMSTNEDALIEMSEQHEIPKLMMELRKVTTLNNMFIQKLPDMRDRGGVVHPTYSLIGTKTGRMASENPKMLEIGVVKLSEPFIGCETYCYAG